MTAEFIARPQGWQPSLPLSCTGFHATHQRLGDAMRAARQGFDLVTAATPSGLNAGVLYDAERACLEMAAELSAITGGSYDASEARKALVRIATLASSLASASMLQAGSGAMTRMRALADVGRAIA